MLTKGKYYVGDLCYALGDKNGYDWSHLLNETDFLRSGDGMFTYKGVTFFSSGTAYGDGYYPGSKGRMYGVDAGLIGCFPLSALGSDPETDGGHIVEFDRPFRCELVDDNGVIVIGDIEISTGEEEEEHLWCGTEDEECL